MKPPQDPIDQYRVLAGIRSAHPSLTEAGPKTPKARKLTKKNEALLGSLIHRMLSNAQAQINIYNLSKLSQAAEDAYMAGGDQAAVEQAVAAAIAKYRENK